MYVITTSMPLPLARAGNVRIIGMMGEKRAPIAPEIPTFVRAGSPDVVAGAVLVQAVSRRPAR